MRRLLATGSVLLLAGCGGAGDSARDQQDPEAAPVKNVAGQAAPLFGWTGDWAATADLCRNGHWRMGRDRIVTAGETSCRVHGEKAEVDGAITLDLACTAEGTDSAERWVLEPMADGRMTVTRVSGGNVIAKVALGRCG